MNRWLIRGATLVNEGRQWQADLRIRDGRIERIDAGLTAQAGERTIDAGGQWLLPGMIDDQVHFREPGLEHKGNIASESTAAVAGGITSFMDMPNTRPPTLDSDALEAKYRRAAGRSRANYAFYLGASNDNIEAIKSLDPLGAPGIKVFMGASTGNMLVDDPAVLDAVFASAPTPIITHCEDTPTIDANLAALRARIGDAAIGPEHHPDIRSREACIKSTRLAIELAERHGTRLHVLHISTADELALFQPGPLAGKRITAETCVHFLLFDRRDYAERGNLIKCNPAIKEPTDRAAIIRAIADDRIDVLATDHAPHGWDEKQQPYLQAPSGLPLVQHALVGALECVHDGQLSLEQVVQKVSHAPAQLFDVAERGFLREGHFADLVLVAPNDPFVVRREDVLYHCGWSPFEGRTFRSRIMMTFVNGEAVWDGRQVLGAPAGQRLRFDR